MIPYADFSYFGALLYVVVPTIIVGLWGRASWRWTACISILVLFVQYYAASSAAPAGYLRELSLVGGFALWQWAIVYAFARRRSHSRWFFYGAVTASLFPLLAEKSLAFLHPGTLFGFLGISYVTFRALDVVFSIRDGGMETPIALDLFTYLFFFPTISSGPIDRYRRFTLEWRRPRTRAAFLADLDGAVHRIFRGFLYKFIIAALIKEHWLDLAGASGRPLALISYMYAYSLYLFFDFAGYSAFAIALSYLFGVHTPENFDCPFLARNIREFWNRWHMTLSFWFRDHVYMRFLLAATRGKWFGGRYTASVTAYFVSFGLMGLWHGFQLHYIFYGLYHATILSGFDIFSRWNKIHRAWGDSLPWRIASVLLTFQVVCFGLLIFSGHFTAQPSLVQVGVIEHADCHELSGWVWDKTHPNTPVSVDISDGKVHVMTILADEFRQDLLDAGYGNGKHAFVAETSALFNDGRPHHLRVAIAGTKKLLTGSGGELVCP